MKKLAILLLGFAAVTATAQEVVPSDTRVQPVIKKDAAPRKSNAVIEQNTKASTNAAKQTTK